MAKQYYGINKGDTEFQITEGSSTTSKGLEVVLDLTAGFEKDAVLRALKMIMNQIMKDNYPPA
jgi:hypothetical protein